MKKSELKKIIEPIVKECIQESIQEVLLESGLVSTVVAEVFKGAMPVLNEVKHAPITEKKQKSVGEPNYYKFLQNARSKPVENQVNEAVKNVKVGGINVFEGVKPVPAPREVQAGEVSKYGALANTDPNDPGVDLSLFGLK